MNRQTNGQNDIQIDKDDTEMDRQTLTPINVSLNLYTSTMFIRQKIFPFQVIDIFIYYPAHDMDMYVVWCVSRMATLHIIYIYIPLLYNTSILLPQLYMCSLHYKINHYDTF